MQLGWMTVGLGAVLCFLGWYGVSGQRYPAQQLPYLASATAPGSALLLGGLVLLATRGRSAGGSADSDRMQRQLDVLYRLLTQGAENPEQRPPTASDAVFTVPGGQTYHRAECLLVLGRADAEPVAPAPLPALRPCPLCDPPASEG
jgi:hypothetical protein